MTGFDNAVVSHLTMLIAVMALVGATVIASALTAVISPVRSRAATEALGWSESACLVIALITAMAPPATPGGSWSSPPLGLPYGIGLPGVVAVVGALMVLGSLARAMAANARSADRG